MGREFTRNMFVMLLTIMLGAILITYFAADIVNQSTIETLTSQYQGELTNVKDRSENFTSHFLKSSVVLDQAREDRAFGNYHFDLAFLWYQSALSEKNSTLMDLYKARGIDNCTNAMPYYYYSHLNFQDAKSYFNDTKQYSEVKHLDILDLYINLTESGSRLTLLRYNATKYLGYLTENLTFNAETNTVTYIENMTMIIEMFEEILGEYALELVIFEELKDEIDEYEFFDEQRE